MSSLTLITYRMFLIVGILFIGVLVAITVYNLISNPLNAAPAPLPKPARQIIWPLGKWIAKHPTLKATIQFGADGSYSEQWNDLNYEGTWVMEGDVIVVNCNQVGGSYPHTGIVVQITGDKLQLKMVKYGIFFERE